ncbi:MAG TPA: tRNA uridine-5-carboxymethylaminomethyl(34) synthesis GTPase MnmE [Candidatus Polarisedimenticolaceae bacterium]|nr:tRNA uridine-5-carboxymethylaminomethyl(34) synthesis GTPase MnmE [Candidatus Polarisedimenticolaceae bacterium]
MHDLSTTLAAVATARGPGGIGCVRISGPDAHRIAAQLCRARGGRAVRVVAGLRFVTFVDGAGRPIDHGYLVGFEGGRSFTGEDTAELWAHGSPPVLDALVSGAIALGARPAGPGEFTYRAVRHGRLDLAAAEAVRDLVASRTAHQARVAFAQVNGAAARRVAPLTDALVDLVARAEAAIEFVDEAETHLERRAFVAALEETQRAVEDLAERARAGHLFRRGARVVLLGAVSVGKSSLFNCLLGFSRAIVSESPGTTRDTIEETIEIEGIPITLVDTAGLGTPQGPVDDEGMRRARVAAGESHLSVVVLDASRPPTPDERALLAGAASVVVANKSDLTSVVAWPGAIPVSAKSGAGVSALRSAIVRALVGGEETEDPAITDLRHLEALERAAASLRCACEAEPAGLELVTDDLRDALEALGTITGEVANDALYDRIFATFCIGK